MMTNVIKLKPSRGELVSLLESGSDEELTRLAAPLFAAAADDAGLANIAADWLQYGRYGVSKNETRAAEFRAKAIDALIPDAIYDHALLLEKQPDGGEQKAFPFYILAAVLGDADAIGALSEYFLYGTGVEPDYFIAGALTKHCNLVRSDTSHPHGPRDGDD